MEIIFVFLLALLVFFPISSLFNLYLITFVRRGWGFRLVNIGLFAVYVVPAIASYAGLLSEKQTRPFYMLILLAPILHFFVLVFVCYGLGMRRALKIAKFVCSLFVMTLVCILVWQDVVTENLYDCTDDNMAGFLRPGDWVHGEVVPVDKIVHGRSMSQPDTIKRGWTVIDLWLLWFAFVAASLTTSFMVARKTWLEPSEGKSSGSKESVSNG